VTALALKYRPATFGDVAGQRPSLAILYRMAKRGTLPQCLLFFGEHGCGKTSLARIVAAALNCEAGPGAASTWPCGACPSCTAVASGTSPDVEEVDAASNGTVDKIRDIRDRAYYGTADRRRVFIIDEAHGLSDAAWQAMLKVTEEPPEGVYFILLTTKPGDVPDTIHSRFSPYLFTPLPVQVIRDRLVMICDAEGFDAEPALLAAIAESARGAMRDAIVRLDQVASAGISSLDMWRELSGETDFAPVLLEAAAAGDVPAMFESLDGALAVNGDGGRVAREVVRCLRDLLVLSSGGHTDHQGDALERRARLAARLGVSRVTAAMAVLWDLQVKVRAEARNDSLALALVMVSRKLCAGAEPVHGARQDAAGVSEIKELMGAAG
jgi:DNA polymerase III subunit gamma/tau